MFQCASPKNKHVIPHNNNISTPKKTDNIVEKVIPDKRLRKTAVSKDGGSSAETGMFLLHRGREKHSRRREHLEANGTTCPLRSVPPSLPCHELVKFLSHLLSQSHTQPNPRISPVHSFYESLQKRKTIFTMSY